MAFLLPILGELPLLIGGAIEGFGASSAIGATVGAAVSGVVTKTVNEQASSVVGDAAYYLEQRLLGDKGASELNNQLNRIKEEAGRLAVTDYKQYAENEIKLQKDKISEAKQETIDKDLYAEFLAYRINKTSDNNVNVDSTEGNYGTVSSAVEPPPETRIIIPRDYGAIGEAVADIMAVHASSLAENNITEHLDDLGITFEGELVPNKTNEEIIVDLVGNDETKLSLLQKLSTYYANKSISKSEEFAKIKEIYNGTGIDPQNVVMSEDANNYYFYIYDETGTLVTLNQEKGQTTLPAVYGIFGGASSPNNSRPINVPDSCFLLHDADYGRSYFNWESDMKLVSRLTQRRESWPLADVSQLNSIVIYFATLGASVAIVKGSIYGDPSTEVVGSTTKDDLFPELFPDTSTLPPAQYDIVRHEFYSGMTDGFKKAEAQSPIMGSGDYRIRKLFESIQVTLI